MIKYYKLPIPASDITSGKNAPTVDLEESIHQMIYLICTTAYKEYIYDERLGSSIWEMDFDNIFNVHLIRNELEATLSQAIKLYEKRVELESIQTIIKQYDFRYKGLKTKVKLRIVFKLRIKALDKSIEHLEEFFIGPLSYLWKN